MDVILNSILKKRAFRDSVFELKLCFFHNETGKNTAEKGIMFKKVHGISNNHENFA